MVTVKILKQFSDGEHIYGKGQIIEVSNNFAFGLYEKRLAVAYVEEKGLEKPQKDKMMRKKKARIK